MLFRFLVAEGTATCGNNECGLRLAVASLRQRGGGGIFPVVLLRIPTTIAQNSSDRGEACEFRIWSKAIQKALLGAGSYGFHRNLSNSICHLLCVALRCTLTSFLRVYPQGNQRQRCKLLGHRSHRPSNHTPRDPCMNDGWGERNMRDRSEISRAPPTPLRGYIREGRE